MPEKKPAAQRGSEPKKPAKTALENNQAKSSGHGGARKNAGRKPGSATVRTREIADKAAAEGVTPLEVMLMAMGALVEQAKVRDGMDGAGEERLKLLVAASNVARDAAPYMHPRLAAVEHSGKDGGPIKAQLSRYDISDDALLAEILADRRARAAAA